MGEWSSQWTHTKFDLSLKPNKTKQTNVVCTIGPASQGANVMYEMYKAGMTVVRLNFSHGDFAYHTKTVNNAREASKRLASEMGVPGLQHAIALDIRGPKIRTGVVPGGKDLAFKEGQKVIVTTKDQFKEQSTTERLYVDYKNLSKVISVGKIIFIEDGLFKFRVDSTEDGDIHCTVLNGGSFGSRKGVNLPGVDVDLPAMSNKDKSDLEFGCKVGVDIIFASFIRDAQGVKDIKALLAEKGGEGIRVFSKVESLQGVKNINEIIAASDGVMVARGDMGIELDHHLVTPIQKMIVTKCWAANKPVIVATQMLESMIERPIPTRAEVSDVQNAVIEGGDAVMLSGESAKGKYPVAAVREQSNSCRMAETAMVGALENIAHLLSSSSDQLVKSAIAIGRKVQSSALKMVVVFCSDGLLAKRLSQLRLRVPILTMCPSPQLAKSLILFRGLVRVVVPEGQNMDAAAAEAVRVFLSSSDKYLIVPEEQLDKQEIKVLT